MPHRIVRSFSLLCLVLLCLASPREMDIRRRAVTSSRSVIMNAYTVASDVRKRSPMRASLKAREDESLTVFDKTNADARIAISESETSRSSTPVTDTSSTWYPASTTSSWATSAQLDGEGSFGDDLDSCNGKWDDDQPSPRSNSNDDMNPNVDNTPLGDRDGTRQSRLRNSVSASLSESAVLSSSDEQDSEESEIDSDDDEEDGPDNDWSGENDSFDATVIAAVDGDLGLAAFLIPLIHKDLNSSVKSKVDQWQHSAAGGSTSASSSGRPPSSSSTGQQSGGSNPRKRRRRSSSNGGGRKDEEEEDGDEDGNHGNPGRKPDSSNDVQSPRLACPFYKMNPSKYTPHTKAGGSKNNANYRICSGPGFKNIQRLKEHLKRNHTPVQCERCYRLFPGSDRAACINQLTEHLQGDVSCERNDPTLKEGISQAQWASLEKQNRKKNQEAHKVEKWFEIWKVLFPHMPPPDSPWYENVPVSRRPSSPSRECEEFVKVFRYMLDYKVQQNDISFPDGDNGELQTRITNLVRQTFKSYVNLRPSANLTDTSSSLTGSGNGPSLLGGSSTNPSLPSTSASNQLTTTSISTATAPGSQQQQALQHPQQFAMNANFHHPHPMAMPMNRSASAYQPRMPMPNFSSMPPGDMNNYYVPPHVVFPGQAWPAGVAPFPMPTHYGATNLGPEFYGSSEAFGAGQDGDFSELQ